ncbi:hypothetical protein B0H16DRAFT_1452989 [Mycena metata]|uniref:Uncharacterized protein n=1 Tax=Mycena metata TaxID=1033252 RepID=A0AAD7JMV0_9AGAR|nr:hypothetical protein B0H16DRAFT_1452989 [Mycena metata]
MSLQYNKLQGPAARATRGERNLEEKRKEWNESTESEAKSYVIQWLIVLVEASEAVAGGVGVGGGVIWSVGCERRHGGNQRQVMLIYGRGRGEARRASASYPWQQNLSLERESSFLLRQSYTLYLHTYGHNVMASDANATYTYQCNIREHNLDNFAEILECVEAFLEAIWAPSLLCGHQ